MKETKTPYQLLSTKDEKKKIKSLLNKKVPYGVTYMEFLIKMLEEIKND